MLQALVFNKARASSPELGILRMTLFLPFAQFYFYSSLDSVFILQPVIVMEVASMAAPVAVTFGVCV